MKRIDKSVYTFSKDNEIFYHANTGEVLIFETMDCFSNQITKETQTIEELDLTTANPAAGPIYVNGAEVGDIIVAHILDISVKDKGVCCSLGHTGCLHDKSEIRTKVIEIEDNCAKFNDISWQINPMIGVIGTAPAEGAIPCGFAGNHGGNMDSKLITKGSTVYLPVRVTGGLFQLGDLHASMGDGEISGTGLEIAGEVIVKLELIKNTQLNWPVTETTDAWYVNTTAPDFDTALKEAAGEMSRLMEKAYKWDTTDNFIYLSMQGDVGINQSTRPIHEDMFTLRMGIPKITGKALMKRN